LRFPRASSLATPTDQLLRYDVADPSKLYGDLAKAWTVSPDGKTYSFELKPGLKFASGNPISAEDVVWSLQRAVHARQDARPSS
jgi:peptide/nickel transport system substrate-binding protein